MLTVEAAIGLVVAVTALVTALTALFVQINTLKHSVNGVVSALIQANVTAAQKHGELLGRDYVRAQLEPKSTTSGAGDGAPAPSEPTT